MAKHLYNTTIRKAGWFVNRFGAKELVMKPLRTLFAPVIIPFLPSKSLTFKERELPYFYHRYNMTWAAERCIEIPIAQYYLQQHAPGDVLEVGNVLSHYFPVAHAIVDKFEKGRNIINQDILEFSPERKFSLILSISTFEHIGFDDDADQSSREKIERSLKACRSMLAPNGVMAVTVPIGYNPVLDHLIHEDRINWKARYFFCRTGRLNWETCSKPDAMKRRYGCPFPYGNAIMVGELGAEPQGMTVI